MSRFLLRNKNKKENRPWARCNSTSCHQSRGGLQCHSLKPGQWNYHSGVHFWQPDPCEPSCSLPGNSYPDRREQQWWWSTWRNKPNCIYIYTVWFIPPSTSPPLLLSPVRVWITWKRTGWFTGIWLPEMYSWMIISLPRFQTMALQTSSTLMTRSTIATSPRSVFFFVFVS